jgi:hypothetical protein
MTWLEIALEHAAAARPARTNVDGAAPIDAVHAEFKGSADSGNCGRWALERRATLGLA